MDTTLTVRLDSQLKEEGERTLDSLGLSMSPAIRVFLTHVVAQQALPFPLQGTPRGPRRVRDRPLRGGEFTAAFVADGLKPEGQISGGTTREQSSRDGGTGPRVQQQQLARRSNRSQIRPRLVHLFDRVECMSVGGMHPHLVVERSTESQR